MKCLSCGAAAEKGFTTSVTDFGKCLIIVRNVPYCKCAQYNEVVYTTAVVQKLEQIVKKAKKLM